MKKIVSLFLTLALLLSMCSFAFAEGETPSWKLDDSPITLKVYYDRPIDAAQIVSSWGNEPVSKKWMEETNINVEWDYAVDESHSKLNMMIAGGEYPDILICKGDYDMLQQLAENDVIAQIDVLAEQYAPGFVERNLGANMVLSMRQKFFSPEHLYAIPTGSCTPERMQSEYVQTCGTGMMVLKSVYESIGSPDMTTIEGTLNAFRKVKEMYPDMIPFQASRNPSTDGDGNPRCIYKLFPFFELIGNYVYDEETGVYKKYWYSENFYELLTFVNTLYNEGLMDPTELTDAGEQLQAKLFTGKIFANMNNDANNIDWFNTELANAGVNDEWIFIEQPSINPEGYSNDNVMNGVGDHVLVIFNNDNAGRALQWVDYVMQDEHQYEIQLGVQGVSWDYDESGLPVIYPEIYELPTDLKKSEWGINLYHPLGMGGYRDVIDLSTCSDAQRTALQFMKKYYRNYSFFSNVTAEKYPSDSEEIKIYSNVKEYWSTEILQMIMCKPEELRGRYDAAMVKLSTLGQDKLDQVIAEFFQNKEENIATYSVGLDLSYMGK